MEAPNKQHAFLAEVNEKNDAEAKFLSRCPATRWGELPHTGEKMKSPEDYHTQVNVFEHTSY